MIVFNQVLLSASQIFQLLLVTADLKLENTGSFSVGSTIQLVPKTDSSWTWPMKTGKSCPYLPPSEQSWAKLSSKLDIADPTALLGNDNYKIFDLAHDLKQILVRFILPENLTSCFITLAVYLPNFCHSLANLFPFCRSSSKKQQRSLNSALSCSNLRFFSLNNANDLKQLSNCVWRSTIAMSIFGFSVEVLTPVTREQLYYQKSCKN